jgi:hypothetical protein
MNTTQAGKGGAVSTGTDPDTSIQWDAPAQVAHGFTQGAVLYINTAAQYVKAAATTFGAAGRVVVSRVYDADNFAVCARGLMDWPAHGKSIGTLYYLDPTTAGAITSTPPATWEQPILVPVNADQVLVLMAVAPRPSRVVSEAVTMNRDNFAPGGSDTQWRECILARLIPNGEGYRISGFKPPTQQFPLLKEIHNPSPDYNIILGFNDAGSDLANRMSIEGGADAVCPPRGSAFIWYDFTSNIWRVIHSRLRPIIISPAALAAQVDNWNPTGIAYADTVRILLTGNQNISGIVPSGDYRIRLVNRDDTDTATLLHESAASAAANRFSLPNAANLAMPPGSVVRLEYDPTSLRWRP